MGEAERITAGGLLPEDFLKEEVICDYRVTQKLKKLWAIELEMAYEFDRVCKKHGLRYFLIWGSLLGAVRHHGFIPWDDDFDVCMPRDDFDKFNKLADEFKAPLFLQNPYTDPECAISHTRLRNSNTTAISPLLQYQKMNQGIFFDVFPLDFVSLDTLAGQREKIKRLNIENGTYMRLTNPNLNEANQKRVAAYNRNHLADYEEIHRLAAAYRDKETGFLGIPVFTNSMLERNTWPVDLFASAIDCNIYGFKFKIPVGYDLLLNTIYPDYMKLPPVEMRGKQHAQYFFDPDRPYTEWVGKIDG